MQDENLINGLLAKRAGLVNLNAELCERMAGVANDIDAVTRVLDSTEGSNLPGSEPFASSLPQKPTLGRL